MNKIKVLICDDMRQIREFFTTTINREPDLEVVGTANNGADSINAFIKTKPDIVLMDIQMESEDAGIYAIEKILQISPTTKVIVITIHAEDEFIFRAYGAGAVDYILKTSPAEEIPITIRRIHQNIEFIRPIIAQKIIKEFSRLHRQQNSLLYMTTVMSNLTTAEMEILRAVCDGKSRQDIAKERFVELVTIKTQISKILKKLRYKNTKELASDLKQLKIFDLLGKK